MGAHIRPKSRLEGLVLGYAIQGCQGDAFSHTKDYDRKFGLSKPGISDRGAAAQ